MGALAYTADEIADALGVTARHVRRMGNAGEIPMRRLGGRMLFPKAAIDRWLDAEPDIDGGAARASAAEAPVPVVGRRGDHRGAAA